MKNTKLSGVEVDKKGDVVPVHKEPCRLMGERENTKVSEGDG